jgi:transposase
MNLRQRGNGKGVARKRSSPCPLTLQEKKNVVNALITGVDTYDTIASRYPISKVYLYALKSRVLKGKKLRPKAGKAPKLDMRSRLLFEEKYTSHPEWETAELFKEFEKEAKETWLRDNDYESEDQVPEELKGGMTVSRRTLRRYVRRYLSVEEHTYF